MGNVESAEKAAGSTVENTVGAWAPRLRKAGTLVRPTRPATSMALSFVGLAVGLASSAGSVGAKPPDEPRAGAIALSAAPPQTVELTLPFTGIWGVVQGFDSDETHVGYAAYALDFVPAERLDQATPESQRHRLTDFPCYGRPVLAPADGKVVWAHDGAPDLPPFNKAKRVAGNFIILQHAAAEFTELRHLQAGSVLVKVGDQVSRGQPIARCGNSGNAKTPHLHVGFLGSVNPIATRPMRLSRYEVLRPDGHWQPGDGVPRAQEILRPVPVDREGSGLPSKAKGSGSADGGTGR